MNHRKLKRLLMEADQEVESGLRPDDGMGLRIRQLDRRRRQRRTATVAALGLFVVGGLVLGSLWRPSLPETPAPNQVVREAPAEIDVAGARAELAALQAEIDRQEANLAALLAAERRMRLDRRKAALGRTLRTDLEREIDRAALTMLVAADWKIERHGMTESARNDYQQVMASFSKTQWADAAKQRLATLQD